MKKDKIINNAFNTGDTNYQEFTQPIKIDNKVIGLYEDQIGDILEYRLKSELNDLIYEIFFKSPYFEKYQNPKRVDKSDMIKMFYYFKNKLIKNVFTNMQIFIGFAEFFQINYEQLYNDISVSDKEYLLKELNEKYNLHQKIKTKRLF